MKAVNEKCTRTKENIKPKKRLKVQILHQKKVNKKCIQSSKIGLKVGAVDDAIPEAIVCLYGMCNCCCSFSVLAATASASLVVAFGVLYTYIHMYIMT